MRRFWDRPLGSKLIVVLTIVFLLEMLAPWQRVCQVTSSNSDPRICGRVTGCSGSGLWAALFAVALLVWELLPIVVPGFSMRGWSTALVTAALGICLAVTTLVKLIDDNEFQTSWAWAGLPSHWRSCSQRSCGAVSLAASRRRWRRGARTRSVARRRRRVRRSS